MEVSADLKASSLYVKLQEDGELETLLHSVRAVVAELAATTVRSVPGFS
jgi:hypothetical protein